MDNLLQWVTINDTKAKLHVTWKPVDYNDIVTTMDGVLTQWYQMAHVCQLKPTVALKLGFYCQLRSSRHFHPSCLKSCQWLRSLRASVCSFLFGSVHASTEEALLARYHFRIQAHPSTEFILNQVPSFWLSVSCDCDGKLPYGTIWRAGRLFPCLIFHI